MSPPLKLCEMINSNQCSEYADYESLYCCEYITDYHEIFLFLITIIVYTDLASVIIGTTAIVVAICIRIFKCIDDEYGIYIMALSTVTTAIATFVMVGLIMTNDLNGTAQQIYNYGCYDRVNSALIIELKEEFGEIIWIDGMNGAIDIIALLILVYGARQREFSDNELILPSRTIYILLYVLRLTVGYIGYFRVELPAFIGFMDIENNPHAQCYKTIYVSSQHQSLLQSQSVL